MKVRGVIVGQVNNAESEGDGATLTLGIKPDKIEAIPENVTAALVPKTLFGEKYVDLQDPDGPACDSLKAGDKITQTKFPIEVERVLNDLYPLLRAVQPAELNYTLNALATALEGRGDKIGESLETLNSYLKRLNPQIPALIDDIKLLATGDRHLRGRHAGAGRHPAQRGEDRQHPGHQGAEAERVPQGPDVLLRHGHLVPGRERGQHHPPGPAQRPILALLARYSRTFPCLLEGIVKQAPRLGETFRGFIFHINLKLLPKQPRGYNAGDKQVYGADNAPNCAGLPNPPIPYYPRGSSPT